MSTGLLLIGILIGLVIAGASRDTGAHPTERTADRGCVLRPSQYGYPDWYIRRRQTYRDHPPLPAFGWHTASEQIDFNVLFHSLFHGYVVVQYRSDLSGQTLETLRKWVIMHADERVTAASAATGSAFAVDVAKWGLELQCTSERELTAQKLDQLLDG
jgi:uncharacterized protein DUF3105